MLFSLLTILEAHLTLFRRHFIFSGRKQDNIRLLSLTASGRNEDKTTQSKAHKNIDARAGSGQDQDKFQRGGTTLSQEM